MKRVLVTGGAGFVGSNLACGLKARHADLEVVCLDNLRRRGSELNLPRMEKAGVRFLHGDVRNPADLAAAGRVDLILECSAEPSVLAGYGADREYVVGTNLVGTINCLEAALRSGAPIIFLSTSRVYPVARVNELAFVETPVAYRLADSQPFAGASREGIDETFPMEGLRTLYGATKYCSELLIQEYADGHGLTAVINRCGVIAGPWQMGRADQGIAAFWLLAHHFGGKLRYIGFGGTGKQVRDLLHVDDLLELVDWQQTHMDDVAGAVFNVGGGLNNSLSLLQMTGICKEITGRDLSIGSEPAERPGDIRLYVTDNRKVTSATGWKPRIPARRIFEDTHAWIEQSHGSIALPWSENR